MKLTKNELWKELQCIHNQNHALIESNQLLTNELQAANVHCTLAQKALLQCWLELENVKKKSSPKSL